MKKSFLIILALVGIIAGCKLDDAGFNQNSIQKNEVSGKWFVKQATSFTPSLPQLGYYTYTDFTAKDYYIFNTNTVTFSTSQPDTVAITPYTYNANSKIISVGPDIEDKFQIIKLTTDSLVWTEVISASTGGDPTYTNVTMRLSRK